MKFKQRDGSDCGPVCLGFVADYYRLRLPLDRIRQIAGDDFGFDGRVGESGFSSGGRSVAV